ncbi:hypothetical protein FCULG_00000109 [Fusarium culmorum]|uniref:Uncharacterized protein n=1 Tax=Fusarium culmorum TaxID=5516 RepID=A0A2T4GNK8_FUSCU|nr:hypothetical protein FCULG_00000109 [Fusarium culmorum]
MASLPSHHVFLRKLLSKKVLIIGGTTGVGFSVARAVLEYGGIAIISGSTPSRLSSAEDSLRSLYPDIPATRVAGKLANLSDPATCEAQIVDLLDYAVQAGTNDQRIDHVVFTAGDTLALVPLKESSAENVLKIAQVRYTAAAILAKYLVDDKYMTAGPEASLTLTAGSGATKPFGRDWALVAGMGAGMEGLVRGLAIDLAPIRVNLVVLGLVETDMVRDRYGKDGIDYMVSQTLVGKIAKPEDVAEAYLYCMKDQFVTGKVLSTDGGRLLV